MSKPKVSVAMCTYNGERYLEAQLASIAQQTVSNDIELIVCDDDSNDKTLAIINSFALGVEFPVRVYRNSPKLGVLKNFVKTFELCNAPLIAYCDQDDVWRKDKLEKCLAQFNRHQSITLVSHTSEITDENLYPAGIVLPKKLFGSTWLKPKLPLSYWGFGHQMVFSSNIVPLISYLVDHQPNGLESYCNNLDRLIPLCASTCGGISFINQPLVKFRRHSLSVSDAAKTISTSPRSPVDITFHHKKLAKLQDEMHALLRFIENIIGSINTPIPKSNCLKYRELI